MNDQSNEIIMNALREAALIRPVTEHPESACLKDDVLVAFADGSLSDSELLAWTPHLSSCRRCQHELASLVRTLNDPVVAGAARIDRPYQRRISIMMLPLIAASAIIVALVLPREPQLLSPGAQHRAPVLTPAEAPITESPVGAVSEVDALRWSAVAHADAYRVTLFDANGRVLFEGEATEPRIVLPDSLKLLPAMRYLWQVQARIGFDRWVSSNLVEFRVISPLP